MPDRNCTRILSLLQRAPAPSSSATDRRVPLRPCQTRRKYPRYSSIFSNLAAIRGKLESCSWNASPARRLSAKVFLSGPLSIDFYIYFWNLSKGTAPQDVVKIALPCEKLPTNFIFATHLDAIALSMIRTTLFSNQCRYKAIDRLTRVASSRKKVQLSKRIQTNRTISENVICFLNANNLPFTNGSILGQENEEKEKNNNESSRTITAFKKDTMLQSLNTEYSVDWRQNDRIKRSSNYYGTTLLDILRLDNFHQSVIKLSELCNAIFSRLSTRYDSTKVAKMVIDRSYAPTIDCISDFNMFRSSVFIRWTLEYFWL